MYQSRATYGRVFAPTSADGPSGLRDLPRPFVLRASQLDGASFAIGECFEVGMNLFETSSAAIHLLRDGLSAALGAELVNVDGARLLRLPLVP